MQAGPLVEGGKPTAVNVPHTLLKLDWALICQRGRNMRYTWKLFILFCREWDRDETSPSPDQTARTDTKCWNLETTGWKGRGFCHRNQKGYNWGNRASSEICRKAPKSFPPTYKLKGNVSAVYVQLYNAQLLGDGPWQRNPCSLLGLDL